MDINVKNMNARITQRTASSRSALTFHDVTIIACSSVSNPRSSLWFLAHTNESTNMTTRKATTANHWPAEAVAFAASSVGRSSPPLGLSCATARHVQRRAPVHSDFSDDAATPRLSLRIQHGAVCCCGSGQMEMAQLLRRAAERGTTACEAARFDLPARRMHRGAACHGGRILPRVDLMNSVQAANVSFKGKKARPTAVSKRRD